MNKTFQKARRFAKTYILPLILVVLFLLGQDEGEISKMWEYLFYYIGGFLVLLVLVEDLDREYFGFLKSYLQVHVWKMHINPKHKNTFLEYARRITDQQKMIKDEVSVWKKMKLKWEISLLDKIKEESGWFTEKYTGKKKNKLRVKYRVHGKKLKNT